MPTPEQEQLVALYDAYEASPTDDNLDALIYFIEQAEGASIHSLLQPEWGEVKDDGVTRISTVTLYGMDIQFTITGEFTGTSTCRAFEHLVIELAQQDFSMPTLPHGTPNPLATTDLLQSPELEVHLDHPRIGWLDMSDSTDSGVWNHLDVTSAPSSTSVVIGSVTHRSVMRMNLHWSTPLTLKNSHLGAPTAPDAYTYAIPMPPIGLKLLTRLPSGGSSPTIDDPLNLGTIGSGIVSNSDWCVIPTDSNINIGDENHLMRDWTDSPSVSIPTSASGSASEAGAWANMVSDVNDYMADKLIYQPDIVLDEDTRSVTFTYEGPSAFTFPAPACSFPAEDGGPSSYFGLTLNWGSYLLNQAVPGWELKYTPTTVTNNFMRGVQARVIEDDPPGYQGYTSHTEWVARPTSILSGQYVPSIEAITSEGPPDGEPPEVLPNPPLITPKPVSGGCKATMDGPSSCNFNVPVEPDPDSPDFPMPGDIVQPDIPDFDVPEMPVVDVDVPTFPPIDCLLPDLGNLSDCPPGPGSGAGLPGGRDRSGKRGAGLGGIKTGGPTYNNRDYNLRDNFPEGTIDPDTGEPIIPPQRSWPEGSSVMTAITIILLDLGISPLNIIFEVGPEWDKTFGPKTFPETTRMFDAAQWLASLIMCRIIDEGDGKVYIGPITHRPGQNTWTFNSQFPNADGDPPMLGLGYGASMGEAYYAVEVWGAHLDEPVFALVDTPFSTDPQNILSIEVGPDYSLAQAQDLAALRAGLIRREAVMVQVEVPYSQEYFMRDKVVLKFPDRGFQSNYILFGKQSEFSIEKRVHILSCVLPATLEELENFPEVMGEGMDAIEMGFA